MDTSYLYRLFPLLKNTAGLFCHIPHNPDKSGVMKESAMW
jgi:hypothetical protein